MGQDRELKFYEYIASLGSQHPGQAYIRGLLETFEISGPTGKHLCLVHPPMHMTIADLQHINPSNIMLTIDDESLLPSFEQAEASDPSPQKFIDDTRTIYGSRKLGLPKDSLWGQPVLCDFGEARIGPGPHKGLIQPELYRAPEVLFDMGWDSSADIWNVAAM
ncbi:hypothetical protein KC355_g21460, partial [Hortaea werneckii]